MAASCCEVRGAWAANLSANKASSANAALILRWVIDDFNINLLSSGNVTPGGICKWSKAVFNRASCIPARLRRTGAEAQHEMCSPVGAIRCGWSFRNRFSYIRECCGGIGIVCNCVELSLVGRSVWVEVRSDGFVAVI